MEIITELKNVLNDTEEPLPKRLKIAQNALNSVELVGINKEELILDWFNKLGSKSAPVEVWETLRNCLRSQSLENVRQTEINQEILTKLIKVVSKNLKKGHDSPEKGVSTRNEQKFVISECALIILKNSTFKQFFKHNGTVYTNFLAAVLKNLDNISDIVSILNDKSIFDPKVFMKVECAQNFVSKILPLLCDIALVHNNQSIEAQIVKLAQKVIFQNKNFDISLNEIFESSTTKNEFFNLFLDQMDTFYTDFDLQKAKLVFKIVTKAFFETYASKYLTLYQFFIIFANILGIQNPFSSVKINLNMETSPQKSLAIFSEIYEIFSKSQIGNFEFRSTKFYDFLEQILKNLLLNSEIDQDLIKILQITIVFNPTIIENIISDIICIVILREKNSEALILYEKFLIGIFEMFFKLHRVHKFSSEILRESKKILVSFGKAEKCQNDVKELSDFDKCQNGESPNVTNGKFCSNINEILPGNVLEFYEKCITQQSGKQIISLMRTFLVFLEEIVNNLKDYASSANKKIYVQILTKLFQHFLNVVRIAEYSSTQLTITKFCNDLFQLRKILGKFGTEILNMEHDRVTINCFLGLSEALGDLTILLKYYSKNPNGAILKNIGPLEPDFDESGINFEIHDFLDSKKWSVIAQRIKNFGQNECQKILNRIMFQKIRACQIFGTGPNEIFDLLKEFENDLGSLLTENSGLIKILAPENNAEIFEKVATQILENYLEAPNSKNLFNLNKPLVRALFFVWISKTGSLIRSKRKSSDFEKTPRIFIISKLKKILAPDFSNFEELQNLFEISEKGSGVPNFDTEKVQKLLDFLKILPIWALEENFQKMAFVFLLAMKIDFYGVTEIENEIEKYFRGLVDAPWAPNFLTIFEPNFLLQTLILNFKNYQSLIGSLLSRALKDPKSVEILPQIEKFNKKLSLDQNFEIFVKILGSLPKINTKKFKEAERAILKEYKSKISETLLKKILGAEKISVPNFEAYILLLNFYLTSENDNLSKLIEIYKKYLEFSLQTSSSDPNNQISLSYYEILLRNKSKFDLDPDFVQKVWNFCSELKNFDENDTKQFNRTLSLVFELVSVEEFSKIMDELLEMTLEPLKNEILESKSPNSNILESTELLEARIEILRSTGESLVSSEILESSEILGTMSEISIQNSENFETMSSFLKIWQCLINSALSSAKQDIFFKALVKLFENVISFLVKNGYKNYDDIFVTLLLDTINNKQITPSGNMIDIYLETIPILLNRNYDFTKKYNLSNSILFALIDNRKYFIIDRLPSYMADVRLILNLLCQKSHTENSTAEAKEVILNKNILDCAFQFEKLIRKICYLKKDMARIAPYLIGDILKNYEKTIFVPGVKNYLDNCIFLLLEICDQHAVSYLFRVLSAASTELFKNIYDNYQKYHKFAGKI